MGKRSRFRRELHGWGSFMKLLFRFGWIIVVSILDSEWECVRRFSKWRDRKVE